jgi:hypothetical protein
MVSSIFRQSFGFIILLSIVACKSGGFSSNASLSQSNSLTSSGAIPTGGAPVISQSVETHAAESFCSTKSPQYPTEWTWASNYIQSALPATTGTPKVEQYRKGVLIATYSYLGAGLAGQGNVNCLVNNAYLNPGPLAKAGCGPFAREHSYRLWDTGDTFLVYPAVYSGVGHQPWFGPQGSNSSDYDQNWNLIHPTIPSGITIQGVTVNGYRPVISIGANGSFSNNTYGMMAVDFQQSNNMVWDNIDIDGGGVTGSARAAIGIDATVNITLSNMRIHDFANAGANGIIGSDDQTNGGVFNISEVELYNNGGSEGSPAHNIYFDAGVDDNFTIRLTNSWSHDVAGGHLFKSRAAINVLTGNYFQGGLPWGGFPTAEVYDVDISTGGILQAYNNIFSKNASNNNGVYLAYGLEIGGADTGCNPAQVCMYDGRPMSIDVRNNTFVNFSEDYDQTHPNYPFNFVSQVPPFPVGQSMVISQNSYYYPNGIAVTFVGFNVRQNAFVGFCDLGYPQMNYHGDLNVSAGFSELAVSAPTAPWF